MPSISILLLLLFFGAMSILRRKAQQAAQEAKKAAPPQTRTVPAQWAGSFPETAPIVVKPAEVEKRPPFKPANDALAPERPFDSRLQWRDNWHDNEPSANIAKDSMGKTAPAGMAHRAPRSSSIIPRFTPNTAVQSIVLHEVLTSPRSAVRSFRS